MARIRTIKPSFFRSRTVRALSSDEKLVWIGLWSVADDNGRLVDEVEMLAGDLWALSLSADQLEVILTRLGVAGRISRYDVEGRAYIQIVGWEHQKISHPTPTEIPPAPFANDSGFVREPLRLEGDKGLVLGGGEPPLFCSKHPSGTESPCRACGDARRSHDAWALAVKTKSTPSPRRSKPDDGHEHRQQHPTDPNCFLCEAPLPVGAVA